MPINLAMKLESLSGYRHLYPPGDSRASLNPVAWSHLKFSLGGRTVSVLSRIADYGFDYSQRTNKLAHHLVLDAPLPPAGPVTLIQQPGVLKTSWDGKCTTLPPPIIPTVSAPGPGSCRTWQRLTGDAGWAGMVAQHWMQPRAKPLHLIFAESQSGQLMQLLAESMALLPPSMFWEATFSTYVTSLPPDIDCKVRCLVAGSEEARAIAARHTVIDLTKPNPATPSGPAVEAARAGRSIQTAAAPVIAKAPEPMLEQKQEDNFFVLPDQDDAELTLQPDRPPPVVAPKLPPSRTASLPPAAFKEPHKEPRRAPMEDRARIATIVAVCSVLLVLALGGLAAWRYQQALQAVQADHSPQRELNSSGITETKIQLPGEGQGSEPETILEHTSMAVNLPDIGEAPSPPPRIQESESELGPSNLQRGRQNSANPNVGKMELPSPEKLLTKIQIYENGPFSKSVILPGSRILIDAPANYVIKSISLILLDGNQENVLSESFSSPGGQAASREVEVPYSAMPPEQRVIARIGFENCKGTQDIEIGTSVGIFNASFGLSEVLGKRGEIRNKKELINSIRIQIDPPRIELLDESQNNSMHDLFSGFFSEKRELIGLQRISVIGVGDEISFAENLFESSKSIGAFLEDAILIDEDSGKYGVCVDAYIKKCREIDVKFFLEHRDARKLLEDFNQSYKSFLAVADAYGKFPGNSDISKTFNKKILDVSHSVSALPIKIDPAAANVHEFFMGLNNAFNLRKSPLSVWGGCADVIIKAADEIESSLPVIVEFTVGDGGRSRSFHLKFSISEAKKAGP
jgi:hypothetical protein